MKCCYSGALYRGTSLTSSSAWIIRLSAGNVVGVSKPSLDAQKVYMCFRFLIFVFSAPPYGAENLHKYSSILYS